MKEYLSQYENEYGERWIFTYNYVAGIGTITGSDVSWDNYQVIDGRAIGLLLNDGELNWLRGSWDNAMKVIENSSDRDIISSGNQEEKEKPH